MGRGGRREGAGRKKVGKDIRIKIETAILEDINSFSEGKTLSERIRNCLVIGLELLKQERKDVNE